MRRREEFDVGAGGSNGASDVVPPGLRVRVHARPPVHPSEGAAAPSQRGACCPAPSEPAPRLTPAPASPEDPSWQRYWAGFTEGYESHLRRIAGAFHRRCGAGLRADDLAADAVQSFLTDLMAGGWLARETEIRYPRQYLRVLLTRHIQDSMRYWGALRRGGGRVRVGGGVDWIPLPAPVTTDGDDASDWLPAAVQLGLMQLEARKQDGHAAIIRDMLQVEAGGLTSADLPDRLGFGPRQLPLRKFRARRAFLRELHRAVMLLTPDAGVARARCRWIDRQVLRSTRPSSARD